MRRLILTAFWMLSCSAIKAQYNLVVDSKFQPLSYAQLSQMSDPLAALHPNYYKRQNKYKENRSAAYSALRKGNKDEFIFYSKIALSTRFSDAQLYYDRGVVFEERNNFKDAKKAYKKAKKKGMYEAAVALEQCKKRENAWKKRAK